MNLPCRRQPLRISADKGSGEGCGAARWQVQAALRLATKTPRQRNPRPDPQGGFLTCGLYRADMGMI